MAADRVVVACAYFGHLAPAAQSVLNAASITPEGRPFVVRIEGGRVTALAQGNPEQVAATLLP